MFIQQLYTNCLAQAAYYIESNGEAAIIDPLRDTDIYQKLAESRHAKIRYIFETHFHADFVSGHLDLASKTGAKIIFGPDATPKYDAYIAKDNEKFQLGSCTLEVLHTPGHTIESICVLLYDDKHVANSIFSGDTLFIGDVGRPDLLSGNLSKEVLASKLYDSIQNKILTLEDHIQVYPGHGAGSPCGRNLGKETVSTIGAQRKANYALQPMSREAFIEAVTKDQPLPPAYFFKDAVINKTGYANLEVVLEKELKSLSASEIGTLLTKGTKILDVRNGEKFAESHITGSVNIGLNGTFAIWAGTVLNLNDSYIIVCENGQEKETIVRLSRIGFENIVGYWNQDINDLKGTGIVLSNTKNLEAAELEKVSNEKVIIVDVRNKAELENGVVRNSIHIPLNMINTEAPKLDKSAAYVIYCAGGYRSLIAASMMEGMGFRNLTNVKGGMSAIIKDCKSVVEKLELV